MKKIIVANWKMNPVTPREAKTLAGRSKTLAGRLKKASVIICPPAVFLPLLVPVRPSQRLWWGAQDVSLTGPVGALTGEISAAMLFYAGARFALIGHSERRFQGETDAVINQKVRAALAVRLKPIICVGERERDDHGHYLEPLRQQLKSALKGLDKSAARRIIVAYEPVWAVGRNAKSADTPAEFLHHALFIRKTLSDLFDKKLAMQVPILYGGSVDRGNAVGFLTDGQADGLLIGRASLDPDEFKAILHVADR